MENILSRQNDNWTTLKETKSLPKYYFYVEYL